MKHFFLAFALVASPAVAQDDSMGMFEWQIPLAHTANLIVLLHEGDPLYENCVSLGQAAREVFYWIESGEKSAKQLVELTKDDPGAAFVQDMLVSMEDVPAQEISKELTDHMTELRAAFFGRAWRFGCERATR